MVFYKLWENMADKFKSGLVTDCADVKEKVTMPKTQAVWAGNLQHQEMLNYFYYY